MARYVDVDKLWDKTYKLECEALEELNKTEPGTKENYMWMATLNERTSFRHDIEDAPTFDETMVLMGYPLRDLRILTEALKQQNVSTDDVKEFVTTLENAVQVAHDSFKISFDENKNMWLGSFDVPTNLAGLNEMMREQKKTCDNCKNAWTDCYPRDDRSCFSWEEKEVEQCQPKE